MPTTFNRSTSTETSSSREGMEKDCSICMEMVSFSPAINCLVTECGHTFHTSCLLNNVLRNRSNGFGCPYCRRYLVDERAAHTERRRFNEDEAFYEEVRQFARELGELRRENQNGNHGENDAIESDGTM